MNQTLKRYLQTAKWGVQHPHKFYVCAVAAAAWPGLNWEERLARRYPNSPLARRCRDCVRLFLGLCILASLELGGVNYWCERQAEKKAIERYQQRKLLEDLVEQSISPSRQSIVPSRLLEKKIR